MGSFWGKDRKTSASTLLHIDSLPTEYNGIKKAGNSVFFSNTQNDSVYNLKWIKLSNNILVCDRAILSSISYVDLNTLGFVSGVYTTIDNHEYKIRVPTEGEWQTITSMFGTDVNAIHDNHYTWLSDGVAKTTRATFWNASGQASANNILGF